MYTFEVQPIVHFGTGTATLSGELLQSEGISRVLIVCDPAMLKLGLFEPVKESLCAANIDYRIFSKVNPNPVDSDAEHLADSIRSFSPQAIIAQGGGSAIDFAKAISILLVNPAPLIEYEGKNRVPLAGPPVMAVPTTAGTSSEITCVIAMLSKAESRKYVVCGRNVGAHWALVDPSMTWNLPAHVTAATGADALTHVIESYTSRLATPLTKYHALKSAEIIVKNLPIAVLDGEDKIAREDMMLACVLAGFSFSNAELGSVHGIAHVLSARFGTAHGEANAALLPYVMCYNMEEKSVACAYRELGEAMGTVPQGLSDEDGARETIKSIYELCKTINLPSLRDLIGEQAKLSTIADDSLSEAAHDFNPRQPVTRSALLKILNAAYNEILLL